MNKFVKKVWGKEEIIANNEMYCGKILHLKKGHRCSYHHHNQKHETFYVMSGKVFLEFSNINNYLLNPEMSVEVKPKQEHRFTGIEDSKIIEFSSHDDPKDSYRSTTSEKIPEKEFSELYEKYKELVYCG